MIVVSDRVLNVVINPFSMEYITITVVLGWTCMFIACPVQWRLKLLTHGISSLLLSLHLMTSDVLDSTLFQTWLDV